MSTLKVNQWLNSDGTENYKCRAWVNFNGTGTVAIRASGNVSSITDNAVGNYTVNFANAMADSNYSIVGYARSDSTSPQQAYSLSSASSDSKTASSVQVRTFYSGAPGGHFDSPEVGVSIFR